AAVLHDGERFALVAGEQVLLDTGRDPKVRAIDDRDQTLPWVIRAAAPMESHAHQFLAPSVHFQLGPPYVKDALAEMARKLGVKRNLSDRAVEAAYQAQREFQARLMEAGRRALATLEETGEPGLILLGRGYNIYDRNINCDIPRKLRNNYGANVIPF
ncbi:MAG: acyl-CoA dehydratase activase-related protein, partial [Acidobacteriota bacterium]